MVECTVECGRLCKIQRLSAPHGSALVNLHVIPVLAPTLSAVVQISFVRSRTARLHGHRWVHAAAILAAQFSLAAKAVTQSSIFLSVALVGVLALMLAGCKS